MKVTVDIPKGYFEAEKANALKAWNEYNENDKQYIDKGFRFEFDIDIDDTEIDESEIEIMGGMNTKFEDSPWVIISWTPDSADLRLLVEYTTKQLNRFKAALESITGLK
jgi:hypothetical protein